MLALHNLQYNVHITIGLTSAHRGVALIISNSYTREDISFSNNNRLLQPLNSSLKNANKLKEAFEHLKFCAIVKCDVMKTELISLLTSFTDYLQSYHQFVFAFFGYGENDTVYCGDENSINVNQIIASISSDVPRLFFFDVIDSAGFIMNETDKKWHSKMDDTENVLVAFVTTMESKASENSPWASLLAKKLITSRDADIFDVIMEVNEELIEMQVEDVQLSELISTLNPTVII